MERERPWLTASPVGPGASGATANAASTSATSRRLSPLLHANAVPSCQPGRSASSLTKAWKAALDGLQADELIPEGVADDLRDRYNAFEQAYRTALEEVATIGWIAPGVQTQADSTASCWPGSSIRSPLP